MQSDDPPFLCLGTEVSAKFKGAFCEAKVKKLVKSIRCKVNLGSDFGIVVVEDKDIKGTIVLNGNVDVMQGKNLRNGVIQHIKDCSQYTVVFNDGDEKDLRRTQVCLKSGRHYEPEVSLDSLPLYNPEHFSNPVVHGNKKRNRQMSVERTPRKRKAKEESEDEEEEEEVDTRKKRRAAHVAAVAMADQGESTEVEETGEEDEESEEEIEREKEKEKEKIEKKKQVKTPEPSPAKKRKVEKEKEKEEERRKMEMEKEEERKRKEREDKKKEKEELKKKKEMEDEMKVEKVKAFATPVKQRKVMEKDDKRTKTEVKAEKIKAVATPKKVKEKEKEKEEDKPESLTQAKDKAMSEETAIKLPGTAVVVTVHKDGNAIYYPALTTSLDAYKKYEPGSIKTVSDKQAIVRSLCTDAYVRVNTAHCVLFDSFDKDEFSKGKMGTKLKAAIGMATQWIQKNKLPKEWTLAEVFGDAEAKRIKKEKVKKLREEEKMKEEEEERKEEERREEEERKRKEEEKRRVEEEEEEEERKAKEEAEKKKKKKEEEKKEKEKERERKEKEKEKEKKAKKQAEAETSESESSESSEDDSADNQERDIFTAQLYKFHEERNTPINKAPVWGGKDLDLHNLYRYVKRYGGPKKCTDAGKWKKILMKLGLGGTGAQAINLKKAYARYLNEFHSTYSQLGWSLEDLSTTIVSGGRSAKKVIDYGYRKKRRERKTTQKLGDKDESVRSGETAGIDDEVAVKKEDDEEGSSVQPADASSIETNSRRSLSRITNSESPLPSTSTAAATPAKRGKRNKGSKEESVVRTMSECTEPALMPAVGADDTLSTVSSSLAPAFPPSSLSPSHEGTSWEHDTAKDNFLPANILTHFYQGMSVRALHSGQWYGARVVQVHQPSTKAVTDAIERAAGGKVKPEPGESFALASLDELREMAKKIRCLVHYLGWNSRYDEYMRLPQIRISQKDDEASIRMAKPKLNENLLGWVGKWSRTREGMTALCGPLGSPKTGSSAMGGLGGYRPRRVSFSQLSASGTSPMGGAVSPSLSERERRERSEGDVEMKMDNDEREEEKKEEVEEEAPRPVTPVVDKKEKRKITKKEEKEKEKEKIEEKKEEERVERVETEKHHEKKDTKKEKEDIETKRFKVPRRTPSPVKLSTLPSTSSAEAATISSPVPPAVDATAAASPVRCAATPAAAAPSTSAAPPAEVGKEESKKGCSISDTIDEVVQLLGSRAEKEKREREERERKDAERMRKVEEAAASVAAKLARQKAAEEIVRADEEDDAAAAEKIKEAEKAKKEVRFEEADKKKGAKGKEKEPEVKGKKKEQKEDENEKKKGVKKVEKKVEEKKVEEEEEEAMDDEDEEFERLHGEAKALGVLLPDLPKESSESPDKMEEGDKKDVEKAGPSRDDNDEKYASDSSAKTISTTIDKSAPPSSAKAKKRKKKGNQSNMVLDRKYAKKSKREDEDESDEEDAVLSERPPHASLSVLKSRMLKAMEADGSLHDFTPLGLPHITQSNLYGERVMCNWNVLEKHAEELREYYYGVRAELTKLEKRNKATIKRRIEKDRAEKEVRKAAKEAAATADQPSTSAAAAALIAAEI